MKKIFIALTIAASLAVLATADAWLGDTKPALIQRYGDPQTVELSTGGDIPTNKGYYVELKEAFTTNVSLIAASRNDYDLDLVETRTRLSFIRNGSTIAAYLGNANEKYDGVDFAGLSAREVVNSPLLWQKNTHGDVVAAPAIFSAAAVTKMLESNKGTSTWADTWHPLASVPGIYLLRTTDKSHLAIGYGVSTNQIHRLEIRMMNAADETAVIAPP